MNATTEALNIFLEDTSPDVKSVSVPNLPNMQLKCSPDVDHKPSRGQATTLLSHTPNSGLLGSSQADFLTVWYKLL